MYYLNIRNITEINSIVCSDIESLKVISFKEKQIQKKGIIPLPVMTGVLETM